MRLPSQLAVAPVDDPPSPDEQLASLLAASARSDEAAFAELYDRTSGRLYGVVLKVVRDQAQAAEVTQDAYVAIWQQAPSFDPSRGAPLSWMLTIAHRRAVDRVRSAQASTARDTRYALATAEREYDSVSESALARLDQQRVRTALEGLTPAQRESISLAYFGGYTYSEVAQLLGLPPGTVKTRIRDGLIRMRDALGVMA